MRASLFVDQGIDSPATVDPDGDAGRLERIENRGDIARPHHVASVAHAVLLP